MQVDSSNCNIQVVKDALVQLIVFKHIWGNGVVPMQKQAALVQWEQAILLIKSDHLLDQAILVDAVEGGDLNDGELTGKSDAIGSKPRVQLPPPYSVEHENSVDELPIPLYFTKKWLQKVAFYNALHWLFEIRNG